MKDDSTKPLMRAWLRKQFKLQRKEVIEIAIDMIIFEANRGYCGVTDSVIYKETPNLWCPWCDKLHRSELHDKLSKITKEQWTKARENTTYVTYENIAKAAGLI